MSKFDVYFLTSNETIIKKFDKGFIINPIILSSPDAEGGEGESLEDKRTRFSNFVNERWENFKDKSPKGSRLLEIHEMYTDMVERLDTHMRRLKANGVFSVKQMTKEQYEEHKAFIFNNLV